MIEVKDPLSDRLNALGRITAPGPFPTLTRRKAYEMALLLVDEDVQAEHPVVINRHAHSDKLYCDLDVLVIRTNAVYLPKGPFAPAQPVPVLWAALRALKVIYAGVDGQTYVQATVGRALSSFSQLVVRYNQAIRRADG